MVRCHHRLIRPPARPLTHSYLSPFRIRAKGCVRFWDVRRSSDDISNGEVLARPNSDIGHFSVGEPYNGEKPLVVWVHCRIDNVLKLTSFP